MGFSLKIGIKGPLFASAFIRGIRDRFVIKPRIQESPTELRIPTNTYECLRIYYDSAKMHKNALRICYELITIFEIGSSWQQMWTTQNFCHKFPIAPELKELTTIKYESFRNFTSWLRFNYES